MTDVGIAESSRGFSTRRRRSAEERRQIVAETLEAGASVARVAMKHGVNANQVFKWKRLLESGTVANRPEKTLRLLPVQVKEEQRALEPAVVPIAAAGLIHIELPGRIRIRVEGSVDTATLRLVLRSLRP